MGAFVEQHAIEHTVDNVSQGSRQDQRHTDDKSGLHALLHELVQKPANDRDCSNAEQGQEQFGEYFHTESHTTILGKVYIEPIRNPDTLMPVHVGLYPNLDNLVYNQYRKYDKAGYPALRKEFTHFYFLPLLFSFDAQSGMGHCTKALCRYQVCRFRGKCHMFCSQCAPKQPAILG